MLKHLVLVFLVMTALKVAAQDRDVLYGQHLLDSIRHLPALDTSNYSIDGVNVINDSFSIMYATVYYDCNGDECFEARKGVITATNDTLPLVFDEIIPLASGELVLIGLQKTIQIKAPLNITQVYDQFGPMTEGLAVFTKKTLYGLIDDSGKVLLPPVNTYIENNEENNAVLIRKDNTWKALEKNVLLNKEIEDEFGGELINSLLKVQDPETYLWAFLSRDAEQLTPYKYEDIMFTAYGDATASIDGYWGMINDEGEEVTEMKYDDIRSGHGVTYVGVQGVLSEKYGLVSSKGELTQVKYSQISTRPLYSGVSNDYYWVAKEANGKWGLLKIGGQSMTDFIYNEIDIKDGNRPKGLTDNAWVELIK